MPRRGGVLAELTGCVVLCRVRHDAGVGGEGEGEGAPPQGREARHLGGERRTPRVRLLAVQLVHEFPSLPGEASRGSQL